MSYVKVWIHAVWATKKREKCLTRDIRDVIFKHIHQNALDKGIYMDSASGSSEHVHCLFRIRNDQMIQDVMRMIKGESSHWINKHNLIGRKFAWQKEYLTISVSESQVKGVRKYVQEQQAHHTRRTFKEEYDDLLKRMGF
ncbi:MAG: IS200/IS605 family transposase [Candidatus Marinimicrobia bacterium]|nr:IS200/IS605 family transposase [Candidatus Neomarinimicrobiota bacterium]MCF7851294.1 IS200/IS605 family transposase [Candidatus Neomarinimicrobiota bacterium]MCF7904762.1 IS200/IS605 family transposase [Candidatus Neomarinimicrobiota bacterium]